MGAKPCGGGGMTQQCVKATVSGKTMLRSLSVGSTGIKLGLNGDIKNIVSRNNKLKATVGGMVLFRPQLWGTMVLRPWSQ